MAASLIAAIFSVVGPGIKQLAAISAAELPDTVAACLIHGFSGILIFAVPLFGRHGGIPPFRAVCYRYEVVSKMVTTILP